MQMFWNENHSNNNNADGDDEDDNSEATYEFNHVPNQSLKRKKDQCN